MLRERGPYQEAMQLSGPEFETLVLEGLVKLPNSVRYKFGTRVRFTNVDSLNESVVGTVEGYLSGSKDGEINIKIYREKINLESEYVELKKGITHFILIENENELGLLRVIRETTIRGLNAVMLPNEGVVFFSHSGTYAIREISDTLSYLNDTGVQIRMK